MNTLRAKSPCPACTVYSGRKVDLHDFVGSSRHTVLQCDGCGLGRIDPLPSLQRLSRWHAPGDQAARSSQALPSLTQLLRAARLALVRWDWLLARSAFRPPRRALDVGAGTGAFVYLLNRLGVDAIGCEAHEGYREFARDDLELDIRSGPAPHCLAYLEAASQDLVTLFQLLHRQLDPVDTLVRAARLLAPGGLIYVEVDDASRASRGRSSALKPPVLYFTSHALRSVAQAAGLQVVAQSPKGEPVLRLLLQLDPSADLLQQWQPSDALRRRHARRQWPRELWHWFRDSSGWRRQLDEFDDRRAVQRFESPADLLDASYAAHLRAYAAQSPLPNLE